MDRQTIGVLVSMIFIIGMMAAVLYFTRKLIAQEKVLFMFILISALLSAVFVVDNVVAFKTKLLSDKENDAILEMMRSIVSLVLGFYFGSRSKDPDKV